MSRRSLAGPLAKSFVFVTVTALATTGLALSIADTTVGNTVSYYADFTDATGVAPGDAVRIAGVQVGQVQDVTLVQRRVAQVHFSVERGKTLPASVQATIKYENLVGQRYVELSQGTGPVDQSLPPGGTIPEQDTTPAVDLTELFNGFQPLLQGLAPDEINQLTGEIVQVLQGEGGTVDQLVSTIGSLTTTLAAKDQVIGQVIDNLNQVVGTVNDNTSGFTTLVATLQELVSGFAQDRTAIGDSVSALSQLTTSTAGLLTDGRAPLAASIAQLGRLSTNLANGTPQLEDFLQQTPAKMTAIGRTASYGSWLNLYLCQATVSGVTTTDGSKAPTGVSINEARCGS